METLNGPESNYRVNDPVDSAGHWFISPTWKLQFGMKTLGIWNWYERRQALLHDNSMHTSKGTCAVANHDGLVTNIIHDGPIISAVFFIAKLCNLKTASRLDLSQKQWQCETAKRDQDMIRQKRRELRMLRISWWREATISYKILDRIKYFSLIPWRDFQCSKGFGLFPCILKFLPMHRLVS